MRYRVENVRQLALIAANVRLFAGQFVVDSFVFIHIEASVVKIFYFVLAGPRISDFLFLFGGSRRRPKDAGWKSKRADRAWRPA